MRSEEFLRTVAKHYYAIGDIEHRCFVFPNRRSLVFFRKYLCETVAESADIPLLAPKLITMGDLFQTASGMKKAERIHLLLKLYSCYLRLNPQAESLDDFVFWGDVLLSDFDDVDKYLVDPRKLFTNVSDFKSIQDNLEWLSEGQRNAIEHFLSHFRGVSDDGADNVKERFRRIWDLLYQLYSDFNSILRDEGLSYEGMAYRSLVQAIRDSSAIDVLEKLISGTDKYVFVGLNALNECEKFLLKRLRDAGISEFCWDYEGEWIRDSRNASSRFMSQNISDFPQAEFLSSTYSNVSLPIPEFHVISVPSAVGQAKQLTGIFREIAAKCHSDDMSAIGTDTAVVLPDESMLISVLNSIPEEIKDINVTMGYPMGSSAFYSLMNDILALQLHLRSKDGQWLFYHRQLWSIFSNSVFASVIDDESRAKIAEIKSEAKYYVPQTELAWNPLMQTIFRPVVCDLAIADAAAIWDLQEYQKEVVTALAAELKRNALMNLELEFAQEYWLSIVRLQSESLPIRPATYARLLSQMVGSVSVPFRGEPLKGLQIMGPLETRALDFDNLIILSCNETVFPRRSVSSSFIPPELRRGFGLPTYEYQDAVWAYYFYRMIHRPSRVWMLCDSRTEGLKSGEESRYIKQLELHFGVALDRSVVSAPVEIYECENYVPKTEEDIASVKESKLSASALKNYIDCPAKFYYSAVKKLKEDTEVSEALDAGMIGNVFHATMCAIYTGPDQMLPSLKPTDAMNRLEFITREYITTWLSRPEDIRRKIRALIMDELHSLDVSGRNLVFENMVLRYVLKTLERDLELMKEYGSLSFRVLGLEKYKVWSFCGYNFIGFIDRMDSFREGEVRIVDYKTGKVEVSDVEISDANAESIVNKLFDDSAKAKPKQAFQLFLYDMMTENDYRGMEIVNSIYSITDLFVSPIKNVPKSQEFTRLMKDGLKKMLEEISDLSVPFRRTDDVNTCKYCYFKKICGR